MALSERHQKILEARGLDVELLVRNGVESSLKLGSDCIVIPYVENGIVVNHKYRTIAGEKKFCQDTGGKKVFWNVDIITDKTIAGQPLVITEGELDAFSAIQSGFYRTVSVPDGAPAEQIGDEHSVKYSFLDAAPQILAEAKEIIIASDGDGPGANLLHDLALRLGKGRCKWISYPEGCKDLNDILQQFGERGVTLTLSKAKWYQVPGVYRMSELPPLPEKKPYRMGIPGLDEAWRLRLGDFTVMTGIPGHGKTTLINEIACRMADQYHWPIVFASFEQPPQTDHRRSLRTWFNRKLVVNQTAAEIEAADSWIERMFSFIVPGDEDDATLEWLLERASAAIIRYGAKIVVVDPWNEMDHTRPPDMTETEYTGFAIKQFRRLARKHLVHVIVAAHPTKQPKLASGEFAVPSLYDINGSAHWYNKCEVGVIVHRSKSGTVIRVAKTKDHGEIGMPGDVEVEFNYFTGRYSAADTK